MVSEGSGDPGGHALTHGLWWEPEPSLHAHSWEGGLKKAREHSAVRKQQGGPFVLPSGRQLLGWREDRR